MANIAYRLEVNYYSQHYEDKCCETSTPIFSLQEGIEKYLAAITEKCIDEIANMPVLSCGNMVKDSMNVVCCGRKKLL